VLRRFQQGGRVKGRRAKQNGSTQGQFTFVYSGLSTGQGTFTRLPQLAHSASSAYQDIS